MKRYNPKEIEPKWQQIWEQTKLYEVDTKSADNKFYIIPMFPYPSGDLHVGHWYNFAPTDTVARWRRMLGHKVLQANGFDSFGLPAENAAIKHGVPPAKWTKQNIATMTKQLHAIGASYDWSKQVITNDPDYYKWTQWLFVKLYEKGLAYRAKSLVNWCPKDQTVLANEQVVGEDNVCERCGTPVIQKEMEQWFYKTTEYAERLLDDLEKVDWPQRVKTMQENWIGKSKGAEIDFVVGGQQSDVKTSLKFTPELTRLILEGKKWTTIRLEPKKINDGDLIKLATRFSPTEVQPFAIAKVTKTDTKLLKDVPLNLDGLENYQSTEEMLASYRRYYGEKITLDTKITIYNFESINPIIPVFTTRPDTIFGATYMVLAPEHPLIGQLITEDQKTDVEKYVQEASHKTELERKEEKEKSGVFTGSYAINPATKEKIPIWIADYVLMGYGTGAIMAVPAHDGRDWDFAKKHDLPIRQVVGEHFVDEANPHRPGFPVVKRYIIVAIIKHPTKDQYAMLKWSHNGYRTFIIGGVERGETPEKAAQREILEETGFKNFKSIRPLGSQIVTEFHAEHKSANRIAFAQGVFVELADLEAEVVDQKEKALHSLEWVNAGDVLNGKTGMEPPYLWQLLQTDRVEPEVYEGEGVLLYSGNYDGLSTAEAREKIVADLAKQGIAKEKTQYRLRDWLISRQRYWGTPIPAIYCDKCGIVPVPEDQLPVVLPENVQFEPTGQSPLIQDENFVNTKCPECNGPAKRETDTMDTFVDSSWYFLRYPNPNYDKSPFDPEVIAQWGPVDHYIGGIEHAILHLLYSRFITKFLHDHHDLPFDEPFKKLSNEGMILGPDGLKMSKSKGNVVSPDEQVTSYGSDSLRLYLMFMGPYDQGGSFSLTGIVGTRRFLDRLWVLAGEFLEAKTEPEQDLKALKLRAVTHRTVKKVTQDLEKLDFNTAIASMMGMVNELYQIKAEQGIVQSPTWRFAIETLTQLLAPFAPHITEELWQDLGHKESVHISKWPVWDEKLVAEDIITIAVQVNGKVRAEIAVSADANEEEIIKTAKADKKIKDLIAGHEVKREIYVPGRLVNLVVK